MDLQPDKTDAIVKPITNTRISASEWNQLVGSCMAFITAAGFTPDPTDNAQFLNAFKAIAADLSLVGANTNLSNLTATGEAHFDNTYAKTDLSNLTAGLSNTLCTTKATTTSSASSATPAVVVTNYLSGSSWYRIYSDGWCEQGGIKSISSNQYGETTVNLLQTMANTNYCLIVGGRTTPGSAATGNYVFTAKEKTVNSFTIWSERTSGANHANEASWYVAGYLPD